MANVFSSKGSLAYAELRERILSGALEPGSRLSQYDLAASMQMSITPLREAVRQLASEGLVVMMTHRDVRVASASAAEARQLLEARLTLEPAAARLAARRRTPEDLDAIRTTAARLQPVTRERGEEALVAHSRFHRAVYAASHNDVMIRMLDDLWDKSDRYRRLGLALPEGDGPRTSDLQQHRDIARLVEAGEAGAVEELSRRHIEHSLSAIMIGALEERENDEDR